MRDVLIAGSGPAGMAAAAELGLRGLEVTCVSPTPSDSWPNTYGFWRDEISNLGLAAFAGHSWQRPTVVPCAGKSHTLERTYLRLDNRALQSHYLEICRRNGTHFVSDKAIDVEHDTDGSTIETSGGEQLRARLVLDCTGRTTQLAREGGGEPAFQTAYGVVADFEGDPLRGDEMVLMDFSIDHLDADPSPPSFLYGMKLDDSTYFVEETVLVGRPAVDVGILRERLKRRLSARGCEIRRLIDTERCFIPMGGGIPDRNQRVVAFGASAGFVHPATGYQMARMFRTAPLLADVVATAFEHNATPREISKRAWDACWPQRLVQTREFFLFGMETLLRLDPSQTRTFFDTFFQLEDRRWKGYLSDTLTPRELARTMWSLFSRSDLRLKAELAKAGMASPRFLSDALSSLAG